MGLPVSESEPHISKETEILRLVGRRQPPSSWTPKETKLRLERIRTKLTMTLPSSQVPEVTCQSHASLKVHGLHFLFYFNFNFELWATRRSAQGLPTYYLPSLVFCLNFSFPFLIFAVVMMTKGHTYLVVLLTYTTGCNVHVFLRCAHTLLLLN